MEENTSASFNRQSVSVARQGSEPLPAPIWDVEDYTAELQECGFSREQATEYLSMLIPIIWHFVDLGFRGDISELLLPGGDSEAVDSNEDFSTEMPSDLERELAAE